MRDRNRAIPAQASTTPFPDEPGVVLTMPSLAAQLLNAAADHLAKHRSDQELTIAAWGRALALADARVLSGYPQIAAQNAGRRAMGALTPDLWAQARTRGEWALLIRHAANTV